MGCSASEPYDSDPTIFQQLCDHDSFFEQIVTLDNGSERNITSWLPKTTQVKAIVFFCHGLHDHSLMYDGLAHHMTQRGMACFGIDHEGHGLSSTVKNKGLISDHRNLVDDFISFTRYIRRQPHYGRFPVFIYCHSIGTMITALALDKIENVVAVVFAGSMLYPGNPSSGMKSPISNNRMGRAFTFVSSSVDPKGAAALMEATTQTHDSKNAEKKMRDERSYHGAIMNKTGYEVLQLAHEAKLAVPVIRVPFLAIHGKDDKVARTKGSQYLYEHTGTSSRKKSLVILDDCKHNPLLESEIIATDFMEQVTNYFDSYLMGKLQLKDLHVSV